MLPIVIPDQRLDEIAIDIQSRLKRIAEDIAIIGQQLTEARQLLPPGEWSPWVARLGISLRTAQRYMRAGTLLGERDILSRLKPSAVIALAAPSCPGAALTEVERRLRDGELLPPAAVDEIIVKYRTLEAVSAGAKALLENYGTDEAGRPTRSISRSAVTSLSEVADDALERAVVEAGDIDLPVSDHIPASVRAAVALATHRRKGEHIEENTTPETRLEGAAEVTMVDVEAGVIVFRVPEIARRLKAGVKVGLVVRIALEPS